MEVKFVTLNTDNVSGQDPIIGTTALEKTESGTIMMITSGSSRDVPTTGVWMNAGGRALKLGVEATCIFSGLCSLGQTANFTCTRTPFVYDLLIFSCAFSDDGAVENIIMYHGDADMGAPFGGKEFHGVCMVKKKQLAFQAYTTNRADTELTLRIYPKDTGTTGPGYDASIALNNVYGIC